MREHVRGHRRQGNWKSEAAYYNANLPLAATLMCVAAASIAIAGAQSAVEAAPKTHGQEVKCRSLAVSKSAGSARGLSSASGRTVLEEQGRRFVVDSQRRV